MLKKTTETVVDLGRLNALSDGIFAFALTLLVLDIRIPEETLRGDLALRVIELAPRMLIYLIGFVVIGGAWGSHQRMLSQIRRGDGPLVWLNFASLLFVTLLPACSALLGRFPGEMIAILCFALDVILIQLTALSLWRHASKYDLLNNALDPFVVRSVGRRLMLSAGAFGLSMLLIPLNATLVYLVWIGLFVFLFATDWLSWQQVLKTTQVTVPLDGAARAEINLIHGAGHLNVLADSTGSALIQGMCSGDVESVVSREGDLLKALVMLRSNQGLINWLYPWTWESPALDWGLSVSPDHPLSLNIQKGEGAMDLDLSKTRVTNLKIETGRGSIVLWLPAEGGQTAVQITSGGGSLDIHIPDDVGAHIGPVGRETNLEIDKSRFSISEDGLSYWSHNYETATNRVDIHLIFPVGPVKIQ